MARASKPRQPAVKPHALSIQLRVNVDSQLTAEIEDTAEATGRDQSEVIRAALKLGLPALRSVPGMVALLQPGVLRESPE